MAKGQHLSRYQQGIVRRYYEHLDSATLQKLQELVSDIYMAAGDEKKLARLWKSANAALEKTAADDASVQRIIAERDVKQLAEFVARLASGSR